MLVHTECVHEPHAKAWSFWSPLQPATLTSVFKDAPVKMPELFFSHIEFLSRLSAGESTDVLVATDNDSSHFVYFCLCVYMCVHV